MNLSSLARLSLLAATAALLAGGACVPGGLQLDGQSLVLRHDPGRDTLDLLIVCRGLHAAAGDTDQVVAQLEAARDHRVFAPLAPLAVFDLDGTLGAAPDGSLQALIRTGLRAAEVHDLGAWLDADGRLCSAQQVHLAPASDVLAALSRVLVARFKKHPDDLGDLAKDLGLGEGEDFNALRADLGSQPEFPLVELRASALVFSLPLADDAWQTVRGTLLKDLGELQEQARAGKAPARATLELLEHFEVTLEREGDRGMLVLGNCGRDESSFEVTPPGPADGKLIETLRARGWTIGGPDGEADARAAFDEATGASLKKHGHGGN